MNMSDSVTGKFTPLDSNVVMAYIVKFCRENSIYVDPTKLQKLLYCCYVVILAKYGVRLTEEQPEAWYYGPVFPITLRNTKDKGIAHFYSLPTKEFENDQNQDIRKWIDKTLRVFGKHKAGDLTKWSHLPGSPWDITSQSGKVMFGVIPDSLIGRYFRYEVLA